MKSRRRYLCARGEALGIALPRNAALLAQVRAAQG
jgi:ketopantoate reductase